MTATNHLDNREHGVRRVTGDLRTIRSADRAILALIAMPPGTASIFAAIDIALRAHDSALASICAHRDEPANPLRGVEGSFACLTQLGRAWPANAPLGDLLDTDTLERCAALDAIWWDPDSIDTHIHRGARALHHILTRAVRRLRPESALVWAGPCSTFLAGARILNDLDITVRRIERGPIPRTLNLRCDDPIDDILHAPFNQRDHDRAPRIADWLRTGHAEHWPRAASHTPIPCDCLIAPTVPLDRAASLAACKRLLRQSHNTVLRPHPSDPRPADWSRLAESHNAPLDPGAPLISAIDAARLVITDSDSIRWTAAALGVPAANFHGSSIASDPALARSRLGAFLRTRCVTADETLTRAGVPAFNPSMILSPPTSPAASAPATAATEAPRTQTPAQAAPRASSTASTSGAARNPARSASRTRSARAPAT